MRTRFAPSPTGPLHLGHAYSAILAHDLARATKGAFLLRIEDIDRSRARLDWETLIYEDLTWLGVTWDEPVMRQSDRQTAYDSALDQLWTMGLIYPCTCNRRDIKEAASAPQEGAPLVGPDGIVYPGTCKPATPPVSERPKNAALRLDMARAVKTVKNGQAVITNQGQSTSTFPTFKTLALPPMLDEKLVNDAGSSGSDQDMNMVQDADHYETLNMAQKALTYENVNINPDALIKMTGDVVLARRDMGTSYHLSVVVDDAAQDISHVIRGADLAEATPIHVLLQALLGLSTPIYGHHRLIRDDAGKRLAKRDDARAIRQYREDGLSPQDIRRQLGLLLSSL